MRTLAAFLTSLAFTGLLGGCGSPLLHHKYEADPEAQKQSEKPAGSCEVRVQSLAACANINWTMGPSASGESQFEFTLTPDSTLDLTQVELAVDLWMPDHGHGSSPVTIEKTANGFLVKEVYFIMPGKWDIRFAVQSPAGTEKFKVTLNL